MDGKSKTCVYSIITYASEFGKEPTCSAYHPDRVLPNNLRGTYELCGFVQLMGKCRYEEDKEKMG